MISIGDIIYFKESGCSVSAKAIVENIVTYEGLTPQKIIEIIKKYGSQIGIDLNFVEEIKDKKFCILIFLVNPQKIEPFEINKKGYGLMNAWITVENINKLKK